MSKFQLLVILIFAVVSALPVFSQVTPQEVDEWNREDQRKQAEAINDYVNTNSIPKPKLFERFIGHTADSWVVSLITEGGIFGTRTLKNINSDGKLLCQTADEFLLADVAKARFEPISSLIPQLFKFKKDFVFETKPAAKIKYCSDCSYQSVVLHTREKGLIVSHKFPLANGGVFSDLYDKISQLDGCPVVAGS